MYNEDWAEFEEAREAFFACEPDVHAMAIHDREMFHKLAASAEREELNHMWQDLRYYHSRYMGTAIVPPSRACGVTEVVAV